MDKEANPETYESHHGQASAEAAPEPECVDFEERGTDAQLTALYAALAAARGAFGAIVKDSEVEIEVNKPGSRSYSFSYADLSQLLAATTPALSANGLAVLSPFTRTAADYITQRFILSHREGARLVFVYRFSPKNWDDMKGIGGQQTYLTRYAYRSILVLPGGDDLDSQPEASRGEVSAREVKRPAQDSRPAPTSNPARPTPAAVDAVSSERATKVKGALKSLGYATKDQADARVARAFHGEVKDWLGGKLTADEFESLMAGLMAEKEANLKAGAT